MKMPEYVAVKIMPDKKGTSYNLEVVTDTDFVNVVRCKDCKYLEHTTINGKPFYPVCHAFDCLAVDDDGYCYRGERR